MNANFGNPLIESPSQRDRPLAVETSLEPFLRRALPAIVRGRPTAVSAASYRAITGCEGGELTSSRAPVRVHVFPGSFRASMASAVAARVMLRPFTSAEVEAIILEERRRAADEAASSMLAAEMALRQAPESPLAIVYAGFHGFDGCVASAERLIAGRPDARVSFVTCACCLPAKRAQLEPLESTGALSSLVVVPTCGGEDEMGQIVSALLRLR
jgi:hypothetical protein